MNEVEDNKMQFATGESCTYSAGSVDLVHVEKFIVGSWEILSMAVEIVRRAQRRVTPAMLSLELSGSRTRPYY